MLSPITRNGHLTYGKMAKLLTGLGYKSVQAAGGHLVYKHSKSGSVVALRRGRQNERVPKPVAAAALRNILNANVSDESRLKRLSEQVEAD